MHKLVFATLTALFLFSAASVSAADSHCYKAYGNTPEEAFRAATKVLDTADAEMGPGWMKDNMQIHLLPNKIKGQFVAIVYSALHHAGGYNLEMVRRIAEEPRPNCDKTRCTI